MICITMISNAKIISKEFLGKAKDNAKGSFIRALLGKMSRSMIR